MKAYLIDPTNRTVTEVEYTGDYRNINEHIRASMFDMVRGCLMKEDGDHDPSRPFDVFVDDEGLINGNPYGWFTLACYPAPLRGFGLVLGHNGEGECIEPKVTLAELTKTVAFPTDAQVQRMVELL